MGGVAKAVGGVVGGAVEAVGDVVEDVGDVVVDDIVKPVVKTVEATVKAAAEDPIGTAVKVAAATTMNPAIIAAANAAVAVAHGADLGEAALAAGKGYAAGAIGAEVSSSLSPEFAASGDLTASQAATAARIAGNVAGTTVAGGDPLQALVNGGIGAGTSAVTSEIPGFADMSKGQQQAVNSIVSSTLKGKDPSQALVNEAIASGISAAQNYSSAPSDTLVEQTIPESEVIAQAPIPVEYQDTPDNIDAGGGWNPASLLESDPNAPDNIDVGGGWSPATSTPEVDPYEIYGSGASQWGGNGDYIDLGALSGTDLGGWSPATGATEEELQAARDALDAEDPFKRLSSGTTDLGDLARSLLKIAPAAAYGTGIALGANALFGSDSKDGYGNLTYDTGSQNVNWNPQAGSSDQGVAYGLDQLGATYTQNAAQGGIMSLAHGGQTSSLGGYASGGNPRLLRGPGDGMSDNIPANISGKQPARLADGEFVMPADVVSHLGNGSTEAGAKVLYQMMERVRKARTGNPNQGRQINAQKFVPRKGK